MADFADDSPASGGEAEPPDFVLELLGELRAAGYHPGAWGRFFARSWRRSRETAQEHLGFMATESRGPILAAGWME